MLEAAVSQREGAAPSKQARRGVCRGVSETPASIFPIT
jgi:hypothetical protein